MSSPAGRISLRTWFVRIAIATLLSLFQGATRVAQCLVRTGAKRPRHSPGVDILMTGNFHSSNWVTSHLVPLANSEACGRLRVVTMFPIPPMPHLELIVPSPLLRRLAGSTAARLLTFVWVGLRDRPDLVAGFHLLLNGLVAQWLARASGAKAMYFCVGGPAEVLGGGIDSENRLFQRLGTPWPTAERMLLESVRGFDMIITMGSRARAYFLEQGFRGAIHVVPGGIDATVYQPRRALPEYDLIFVGRLVPIKRVDVFLRCVQILVAQRPALRAVIVGEGPLLPELQALAAQLGVASHVHFAGKHQDVSAWLNRARLFMLTSDSEGLSLALMEAMLCGLPAVVSNVGDLPDLVRSGENGYLVSSREPQAFADCALNVLADVDAGGAMAARARELAHEHELQACTFRWDRILPGV